MKYKTIYDFLKNSASKWPDKAAVIKSGSAFSYSRIYAQSGRLSDRLKKAGIRNGDRVGIYLDKSPEEVVSIFAAIKAGAIFVILNPKLKDDQILHILNDCRISALLTAKNVLRNSLKKQILKTSVNFLLFTDKCSYDIKRIGRHVNPPPFHKGVACIIYTSGSTGKPKGVTITHKNLIDGAEIVSQYLGCGHDDRVLSLLPFSFDYGQNQLLTTFKNGATIILQNYVFPGDVFKAIEGERITALAGIPTIWISLVNHPEISKYNLSTLRYVTNSGGKIPVEYVNRMIKIFRNTKIYLMYGLTEAFRSTYLDPALVRKRPDSIGKAIPRVFISVLDKAGKECKAQEPGELVHRGALISLGYWGNKEATDSRIRKLPAGAKNRKPGEKGVFSGDLVKKDKDGFLYYIGRNDEMIKSSGYRISPTEIEEVMYRMKTCVGAVVFGKEDPGLGQKIVAVLLCKNKNSEEIIKFCKNYLPDYAIPHEIIFLDQMPKTSSGKLDRSLIKARYDEYRKN